MKMELLSIVEDYISRYKDRDSKEATAKLKVAYFIKRHRVLEKVLLFVLRLLRIFFKAEEVETYLL